MLARLSIGMAALALVAAPAVAGPLEATAPGELSLYEIYNQIYAGDFAGYSDHSDFLANAEQISTTDFFTNIMQSSGSITAQAHYAWYAQTFGLYQTDGDGNIVNSIEMFNSITPQGFLVGSEYTATFDVTGSVDGFYNSISEPGSGTPWVTWYSDDALNWWDSAPDTPHMLIYRGQRENEYVIAWEDMPLGMSDRDYNDLVLTITLGGETIIPEPTTVLLLGMGLAGVAARRMRRKS
jgi:hypothetical protein